MPESRQMPLDQSAEALFVTVYARLKAMAAKQLAGRRHATLDTTELVHELYLRMGQREACSSSNRRSSSATPRAPCATC